MGLEDKFKLANVARALAEIAQTRSDDPRRSALRKIGLIFLLELKEPLDGDRTMNSQAKSVRQQKIRPITEAVDRLLFPPSDDHGPKLDWTLDFMFRRAPMGKSFRGSLTRFLRLTIPKVSFDDLEPELNRVGCNRYDLGYAIRDGLNAIFERNTQPTRVVRVMPDKPYDGVWALSCHGKPNGDPTSKYGWEIGALSLPQAWALAPPGTGNKYGAGIFVGHPDTGYSGHPALTKGDRLLENRGEDYVDDDSDAQDALESNLVDSEPGHGTMTATQIMSSDPNNPESPIDANGGVIGAAPRARIVPIRVCDWTAFIINGSVAEGIVWAVDQGCHVISLSVGGLWVPGGEDAVQQAYDANVIVVAAAGNCIDFVAWPAAYDNCLAVGASKVNATYWEHAPDRAKVAFAAPGDAVRTTCINVDQGKNNPKYSYNWGSGTSFATAFTAGVCALWLAFWDRDKLVNGGLGKLQDVFTAAAKKGAYPPPAGWDTSVHGAGILNAQNMLTSSPFGPAQGQGPAQQSSGTQSSETFLGYLTEVLYGQDDKQNQNKMLQTTRTWFGLPDDISATATLDDLGGEMVNGLVEYGLKLRDVAPITTLTGSEYYTFFQTNGSFTLNLALAAGSPGP